MPLSDQERRCVDLTCQHLTESHPGDWRIADGPLLEELHRNEPVPEVLVTNGTLTAAVEVKRLADRELTRLYSDTESLRDYLVPACGGFYSVDPSVDVRLPLLDKVRRRLKKEIAAVAPTLAPGEKGVVRIPQEATLSLIDRGGPGHLHCCHEGVGDSLRIFSTRLSAKFFLADCECWAHKFVTDQGREAFAAALLETERIRLAGGASLMQWLEEWELHRSANEDKEDGVWFISVTEAHSVPAAVSDVVDAMLSKSLRKFARRWADIHILVFERASAIVTADLVEGAIPNAAPNELALLDEILYVHENEISSVWLRPTDP